MQYYPSDNSIFEDSGCLDPHGTKQDSLNPRDWVDEDEAERNRARQASLRQQLVQIVGSEDELDLHLKVASGEISFADLARMMGVHRSTVLRRVRRYHSAARERFGREAGDDIHAGSTIDYTSA